MIMNVTAFPPRTADQINAPQMGQVTISETDPGEPAQRAAVPLKREQDLTLSLKLSRDKMIEAVKNSRIPLALQELLLEEIALVDPKHDLLRLDLVRHAHGAGANASYTVKEI